MAVTTAAIVLTLKLNCVGGKRELTISDPVTHHGFEGRR